MVEGKDEQLNKLARDVLILSRNTLLVNLRFLDMALSQFRLYPKSEITLATDGKHIFYNPRHILSLYVKGKEMPVRDYLHLVFHCVFKHMYASPNLNRLYWDLACDIAVENIINELRLPSATAPREGLQAKYLLNLKKELKNVTAEKIYSYLCQFIPDPTKIAEIRKIFMADDHEPWYMTTEEKSKTYGNESSQNASKQNKDEKQSESSEDEDNIQNSEGEDGKDDNAGEEKDSKDDNSGEGEDSKGDNSGEGEDSKGDNPGEGEDSQDGNTGEGDISSNGKGEDSFKENKKIDFDTSPMADVWQKIAERMQVDMKTFGKQQGYGAGGLTQNLAAVTREKYDYTEFLKKFAVWGEAMKINDDEFDYIFYTYGLKLYDNMPLIEPLEYKDVKAIREFVIAIDTSGSTSGDLVQKFVQKTYNVLKSSESFFTKIKLYIIQCDAEIQESVKITSQEEFDDYLKKMKLKGFGGTDFRPVFEYVDKLILKKEFLNLKGLIYFTDGYGEFPAKKPKYETAFVFIDDEYDNPDVPSWAIKLVLQKDEI